MLLLKEISIYVYVFSSLQLRKRFLRCKNQSIFKILFWQYKIWSISHAFCWTVLDNFCLMSIEKASTYSVSFL